MIIHNCAHNSHPLGSKFNVPNQQHTQIQLKQIDDADIALLLNTFSKIFATKEDLEDLRREFCHLPTKEEFYKSQDELVTRLKKIEENTDIMPYQISENTRHLSL